MIDANQLVVLVDGSSYLFRAFHGLPPLTNAEGHPTGALHGVIKMLTKLYDDYQPAYFGVVFDAKGKTFRHDLYSAYKANRPKMPEELACQIKPLHQLIEALGFALIIEQGVEADDVIGTLAARALKEHYQVVISSGDKDMAQLLTHADITLLDTMKNAITSHTNIAQRFKVDQLRADQVIDFLALVGDTSDNIPGIDKVGPKTAAKWLQQYDNIDTLIDNASKISGKIGDNLRNNLDTLKLSRTLATIKCDLPLTHTIADLALQPQNPHKLEQLCNTYGLNSIKYHHLNRTPNAPTPKPSIPQAPQVQYHTLTDPAQLPPLIAELKKAQRISIDTETTSLNYQQAQLVGISLALETGHAYYLPLAHQDSPNLPLEPTLTALKPILENPAIIKIGQHLKYDRHILNQHHLSLNGTCDDTMLMSYCYNATATRHNLDALADHYLNYQTTTFEDIAGKGSKQLTFDQIPLETAAHYACEDADLTLRLYQYLHSQLQTHPSLNTLYQTLERPLANVLYHIEAQGVKIDPEKLHQQSQEIQTQLTQLEQQAHQHAGQPFNLNSPKQLQHILFDQLNLPILHKTPKGQPSTNEDSLQDLTAHHPLPALILEHRSLAKLKSTYTDKLPHLIDPTTQRIHTSYHQAITSTGRLSSSDPNLQNIPIRSEQGRRIRQAFIAPQGMKILAADYSQIELRIMAHLSNDPALLKAFNTGQDIHSATAAELFNLPQEQLTREHRRKAKAINFGLIYGMSAFGLARQLNISRDEAAHYIDTYFNRYPKVKDYMNTTRQRAKEQGYVETLTGRRLYISDINSKNAQRRQAAERLAINAPMQGSAADIIKKAMLDIDHHYHTDPRLNLIMQVHDELVFEIQTDSIAPLQSDIIHRMQNAHPLNIPLIVEAGIGDNWDEAH